MLCLMISRDPKAGRQVNENMGQQLCVAKGTAAARMLESRVLLCVAQ